MIRTGLDGVQRFIMAHHVDCRVAGSLFVLAFVIFVLSPSRQMGDSRFSMMLSESLIHHLSFTLDAYSLPRHEPLTNAYARVDGELYQIEWVDGHLYYLWPPGSSLLSVPFVAVANLLGVSIVDPEGSYNSHNERGIQGGVAALVMALFGVVLFATARQLVTLRQSILIVGATLVGTAVYSTASRGLWSETWGILLVGIGILLIVARERGQSSLHPCLLATCLAWSYFCTPKFWVAIAAITIYILLYQRRFFVAYAATGAAWAAAFVGYSWYHFHQLLPNYYQAYKLFARDEFVLALEGNLISPSRGMLVFTPVLLFVFYLLIRYWRHVRLRRLVVLSTVICVAHMIVISCLFGWYGGYCYGPRYSVGIIPFLFLMSVLAVDAWLNRAVPHILEKFAGSLLLVLSILVNGVGAIDTYAIPWNAKPDIVKHQDRVWDWNDAQFLVSINRWLKRTPSANPQPIP